jgi:hypothetical protein
VRRARASVEGGHPGLRDRSERGSQAGTGDRPGVAGGHDLGAGDDLRPGVGDVDGLGDPAGQELDRVAGHEPVEERTAGRGPRLVTETDEPVVRLLQPLGRAAVDGVLDGVEGVVQAAGRRGVAQRDERAEGAGGEQLCDEGNQLVVDGGEPGGADDVEVVGVRDSGGGETKPAEGRAEGGVEGATQGGEHDGLGVVEVVGGGLPVRESAELGQGGHAGAGCRSRASTMASYSCATRAARRARV